ncbi:hypothetical protein C1646_675698 [Rhizophagus diaphanus]|nr:hypothetical protein C1646_675698 [Rhizophagus diaphanus] [Rhizophagus sp. MUCL 43196]
MWTDHLKCTEDILAEGYISFFESCEWLIEKRLRSKKEDSISPKGLNRRRGKEVGYVIFRRYLEPEMMSFITLEEERFWSTIADKINQENGISFNSHQCKEKFLNLVWDYNAMCDFMSGRKSSRSRLSVQYFDEFRTHFWKRPEDEFDRVRSINTFN